MASASACWRAFSAIFAARSVIARLAKERRMSSISFASLALPRFAYALRRLGGGEADGFDLRRRMVYASVADDVRIGGQRFELTA